MGSKSSKLIYTLGTSNRTIDEFLAILGQYNIKKIIDVRRFPRSTRYPHFNQEKFSLALEKAGHSYFWLGDLLGGFRNGGYDKYRAQAPYKKGLEQVQKIAEDASSTLVCAEKLPWKCHRLQLAKDLNFMGWKVIHIIDIDRTWSPIWDNE